jgi:hypothetical protein
MHTEEIEEVIDALLQSATIKPTEAAEESEHFTWCEAMIEAHITGKKTDFPANLLCFFVDVKAADIRCSRAWLQDRRDHSQGCRFPGSIRAEQAEDFTVIGGKRDMVDGDDPSTFFILIDFGQVPDFDHLYVSPPKVNEGSQ